MVPMRGGFGYAHHGASAISIVRLVKKPFWPPLLAVCKRDPPRGAESVPLVRHYPLSLSV